MEELTYTLKDILFSKFLPVPGEGLMKQQLIADVTLRHLNPKNLEHCKFAMKYLKGGSDLEKLPELAQEYVRITLAEPDSNRKDIIEDFVACINILRTEEAAGSIEDFLLQMNFFRELHEEVQKTNKKLEKSMNQKKAPSNGK